jgi:hypothetical protein
VCSFDHKTGNKKSDCGLCHCRDSSQYGTHNYVEADVIVKVGKIISRTYKCSTCGTYK